MENQASPNIELDPPVVVSQAPADLREWGPWQFPALERLSDGRLQIAFHVAEDAATAYGTAPGAAISDDDGQTWTELESADLAATWVSEALALPNGDRLRQVVLPSRKLEEVQDELPEPFATWTGGYGEEVTQYLDERVPAELAGWRFARLASGTQEWVEETANVRMPGARRHATSGVLVFPRFHRITHAPDGSLWGINHSLRVVDGVMRNYLAATFIQSTDHGRTWDLLSEIPYQPNKQVDKLWEKREGFTEPDITFLPDGSVFCLLRTSDGSGEAPLYVSRSTDNGHTWSKPTIFDDLGVWPALLTLPNGVTLASYGRPGLYVRATDDPTGHSWGPRVTVVEPGEVSKDTCSYSALIALDDHTALIGYSDFNYPDKQGTPRKTILTRRVSVR